MVFIETDSAAAVKKLANMGMDIAAVREIKAPAGEGSVYRVEAVVDEFADFANGARDFLNHVFGGLGDRLGHITDETADALGSSDGGHP